MEKGQSHIQTTYGNRIRVRVCGFLISEGRFLLLKHRGLGTEGYLWSPPGGGVDFGESLTDAIKREFLEETGLNVAVGEMLFISEFVEAPLHAIEIFFEVKLLSGILKSGIDPEHSADQQIIEEVGYMSLEEIKALPKQAVHKVFHMLAHADDIYKLKGLIE